MFRRAHLAFGIGLPQHGERLVQRPHDTLCASRHEYYQRMQRGVYHELYEVVGGRLPQRTILERNGVCNFNHAPAPVHAASGREPLSRLCDGILVCRQHRMRVVPKPL